MPRRRHSARGHARAYPVGVLKVASGGFGFVDTPEGSYFVPERKMRGAFDGDTVEIAPLSVNHDRPQPGKEHNAVGRKPTARVVNVVRRAHETLIGRYEIAGPFGVVVPADARIRHDIFTVHADNPPVGDGDMVRVRITQYPSRNAAALGVVEEVVGRAGEKGSDIETIIAEFGLRVDFPADALAEASEAALGAEEALREGYRDLRDRCVFTIDPEDARDFDDALSLDEVDGHWRLGVHIADVSWYVRPGSALDAEARMRATSVYLVDRVLPMLPPALSNGVCSLAPGEDRRCMTVDIALDDGGSVLGVSFYPAVIRSDARLDYTQVQAFFDCGDGACGAVPGQGAFPAIPPRVVRRLLRLRGLSRTLKEARRREGALDLESSEVHMVLDADGAPVGARVRRSTEATELVEQCMVLANAVVARRLAKAGEPAIFRVHDAPDPASLAQLVPFLQEFGYTRSVDVEAFVAGDAHALQEVLEASRSRDEGELVSLMMLRSLKRASYSPECSPHFGLALGEYVHFTSPIRRYPDLVVHRALKAACGVGVPGTAVPGGAALGDMAEHSSAMERAADEAALQSQTLKLVEYLARFIGEVFEGVVSRVTRYGFFVRLENSATGLVPLGMAGDEPFSLDARRQMLVGQDSGRVIRLGQRVSVRLVAARPAQRELDFELA